MDEGCTSRGKSPATSASVAKSSSWDFPPPSFNIMEEIEELTPRGEGTSRSHQKQALAIAAAMSHTINTPITPLGMSTPPPVSKSPD